MTPITFALAVWSGIALVLFALQLWSLLIPDEPPRLNTGTEYIAPPEQEITRKPTWKVYAIIIAFCFVSALLWPIWVPIYLWKHNDY